MAPGCMMLVPLSSCGSACTPVAVPVMMSPSERKNSAARDVSSMLTSDVRAWELVKTHIQYTHTSTHSFTQPVIDLKHILKLTLNWDQERKQGVNFQNPDIPSKLPNPL